MNTLNSILFTTRACSRGSSLRLLSYQSASLTYIRPLTLNRQKLSLKVTHSTANYSKSSLLSSNHLITSSYREFSSKRSRIMSSNNTYTIEERGARNTTDYRVYFKDGSGNLISPWHDIPLYADSTKKVLNMIVEIPRWTNAKMEIATAEPLSPIKQDVKKGALRYVRNPFPHKGYIWNYGAFPQTWEDPKHIDPATQAKGDNDPIDVLEIGQRVANRGEVMQVKVLGTIALIDEGETDWKVITINTSDPLADSLNDIGDIEKVMPGFLRATVEWFKIYKIPDGKPANEFAFNGEAKNREFAEKIIEETAGFWKTLIGKETNDSGLDLKNTTLSNSASVKEDEAKKVIEEKPATASVADAPIADQSAIDKWYYIRV